MATFKDEQLAALIEAARRARATLRQGQKAAERARAALDAGKSLRAAQERSAECFRQLSRDAHELHCLAVEMGLAAPQPERYGEKIVNITFGREVKEIRREPKA